MHLCQKNIKLGKLQIDDKTEMSFADAFRNLGLANDVLKKLLGYQRKLPTYTEEEHDRDQVRRDNMSKEEFKEKHGKDYDAKYETDDFWKKEQGAVKSEEKTAEPEPVKQPETAARKFEKTPNPAQPKKSRRTPPPPPANPPKKDQSKRRRDGNAPPPPPPANDAPQSKRRRVPPPPPVRTPNSEHSEKREKRCHVEERPDFLDDLLADMN